MIKKRYIVKNRSGYSSQLLFTSDDLSEAIAFADQYDKKSRYYRQKTNVPKNRLQELLRKLSVITTNNTCKNLSSAAIYANQNYNKKPK